MSRKYDILTIVAALGFATAGCSEQAPHEPEVQSVPAASPSQAELERVTAENQWLREQLQQEKARADTAEARVKELEEQGPKAPSTSMASGSAEESGRKLAQWVLKLGGSFDLVMGGQATAVRSDGDLPEHDFSPSCITGINLARTVVEDSELVNLSSLSNLRRLDLSYTRITGSGFEYLQPLDAMDELNLHECKSLSSESLAHLKALPSLKRLNLCLCSEIGDSGMEHLARIIPLESLNLYATKVGDAGIERLKTLTNLTWLGLSETKVSNNALLVVAGMPKLRQLEFATTAVTDEGLAHLSGHPQLQNLVLQNTGVTDAGLEGLKDVQTLELLWVSGSKNVTGRSFPTLAKLPKLTSLLIHETPIDDDAIAALAESKSLRVLGLKATHVTDKGIERLASLTNLRELYISSLPISDKGIEPLKDIVNLERLDLRATKVTDEGVAKLKARLPRCNIEQ